MSRGKQIQIPEEMDDKWASGGHVGITASTGELSDNHDVVRLATYVNSDAAERGEEARGKRQQMEVKPVRDRFCVVGRLTICDFTLPGVCRGGEGTLRRTCLLTEMRKRFTAPARRSVLEAVMREGDS